MQWVSYGKTVATLQEEGLLQKGVVLEMPDGTHLTVQKHRSTSRWGERFYDIGSAYVFKDTQVSRYGLEEDSNAL